MIFIIIIIIFYFLMLKDILDTIYVYCKRKKRRNFSNQFVTLSTSSTYCPTRSDSCTQGVDAMLKLRLGLMKLLEMKLFNLPSEHVPAVIGEVLKAEYMLVWAYHDADNVREFAIRVSHFP